MNMVTVCLLEQLLLTMTPSRSGLVLDSLFIRIKDHLRNTETLGAYYYLNKWRGNHGSVDCSESRVRNWGLAVVMRTVRILTWFLCHCMRRNVCIDAVCDLRSIHTTLTIYAVCTVCRFYVCILGWTCANSKSQFLSSCSLLIIWWTVLVLHSEALLLEKEIKPVQGVVCSSVFYTCVCTWARTTLQVCLISLSLLISNELLKSHLEMNTSALMWLW